MFSLFHFPHFRDSLVYYHVVFVEQVCLPTQYLNGCFCFFGHPVSKNNNNQKREGLFSDDDDRAKRTLFVEFHRPRGWLCRVRSDARTLWRSTSELSDAFLSPPSPLTSSEITSNPSKKEEEEEGFVFGKLAKAKARHFWNESVDFTFKPIVDYLSKKGY